MGDSWYVYSTRGHIRCYQHINTSCMRGACEDHVMVMWALSELWWTAEGQFLFACSMHTPVFDYSTHTVSNQKTKVGNAGNETIYDSHVRSCDGHVMIMWCHVMIMWWSCDDHVVVMWWSCDDHVVVMWWSCGGHVMVMWRIVYVIFSTLQPKFKNQTWASLASSAHSTV